MVHFHHLTQECIDGAWFPYFFEMRYYQNAISFIDCVSIPFDLLVDQKIILETSCLSQVEAISKSRISLYSLTLKNLNLESIPNWIKKINCSFLTFENNRYLKKINNINFSSLIALHIKNCPIQTLPNSLDKLQFLKLEDCLSLKGIENIDLSSLSSLHIENCSINTLPDAIGRLKYLNFLTINKTRLTKIPDFTEIGEKIPMNRIEISITNSELSSFNWLNPRLVNIDLSNNKFTELPTVLSTVGKLIITYNPLTLEDLNYADLFVYEKYFSYREEYRLIYKKFGILEIKSKEDPYLMLDLGQFEADFEFLFEGYREQMIEQFENNKMTEWGKSQLIELAKM
ncbi:MAG: hypothetical protein INQ03_04250 [Candidatus Heimdallarchaeota archaeon]|nr:hypothetical protein [Candidatus Heimdallarchaeota archaeon]